MNVEDLDDDEIDHLSLWLAKMSVDDGAVDLRMSPAWQFALRRVDVSVEGLEHFPKLES